MYGNNNADKVFLIPFEWIITDSIEVKANSLEEAVKYILDHTKITANQYDDNDANTLAEALRILGAVEERDATKYDVVDRKLGGAN